METTVTTFMDGNLDNKKISETYLMRWWYLFYKGCASSIDKFIIFEDPVYLLFA